MKNIVTGFIVTFFVLFFVLHQIQCDFCNQVIAINSTFFYLWEQLSCPWNHPHVNKPMRKQDDSLKRRKNAGHSQLIWTAQHCEHWCVSHLEQNIPSPVTDISEWNAVKQLKECNQIERFHFYNLYTEVHNTIKILKSNIWKDWFDTIYKLIKMYLNKQWNYFPTYLCIFIKYHVQKAVTWPYWLY